jgi:hypothetical protein
MAVGVFGLQPQAVTSYGRGPENGRSGLNASENRLRAAKSERSFGGVAVGALGRADPNRGSRLERPVLWPRIPHPTRSRQKAGR